MRYLLAYFALMIGLSGLSLLAAGRALGFVLVLVAAFLIYLLVRDESARRRARRFGGYEDAIEGYEKHFVETEEELEAKLPENALDSPALLELLSVYEHEGTDEADAIRAEYEQLRLRFKEWQEDFERLRARSAEGAIGLPARFAEQYDELDQRLSDLVAEVGHLERRAAETEKAAESPLEEIARAALKLEETRSKCRRRFGVSVPAELEAGLEEGEDKLAHARAAIAKGAERPLAAIRFAREAFDVAASIARRVDGPATAPG
jgi:chromosome segregation ATPase